ncbi:MAG: ATP12 family protein [Pseudomonadota bacterium]
MRDILNDLSDTLSDTDPVRRAQIKSKRELPGRFYEKVDVDGIDGAFHVRLDGRTIRTPARQELRLPTRDLAELVCREWEAQSTQIDPITMPVTRLVNTALDGIASDKQAIIEDILRFAGTDLLCYRADSPQALVELQNELWDPVLDWARSALGAHFQQSQGIMHVEQPRAAVNAIGIHVASHDSPMALASLHIFTTLTGSAILSLAVAKGHLTAEEAWMAAHVDEDWNISQWGEDAEAAARRRFRWTEMQAADQVLNCLSGKNEGSIA